MKGWSTSMLNIRLLVLLEFIGAICGIIGALLMAIDPTQFAAISFPIWLISSVVLSVFAFLSNLKYLLGLQITFTVINIIGVVGNTL